MRDVWKSALEWYIYYGDVDRKLQYANIIMAVKDRLRDVRTKADLMQHYMATNGLCESVAKQIYPDETWVDARRTEDVAYGLRCLELSTGKRFDLRRRTPSRWLIETVA